MLWKRFKRMVRANVGRLKPGASASDQLDHKIAALKAQDELLPGLDENLRNTQLSDAEVADIVAFLGSLTGELPDQARMPGAPGEAGEAPNGETAAE